jgi:Ala-tRNA(Pro) deacylase
MDATSAHQESLPVSSDALLDRLRAEGVEFELHSHRPLRTVAESKEVQAGWLSPEEGGGHVKNLYLRDHRKRNYLVVAEQDRAIDLKALAERIGSGRLSFGSPERLLEHLSVRPGAVTPFAMITGVAAGVELWIDAHLRDRALVYAHPLVNDRTVALAPDALFRFLRSLGCEIRWLDDGPPARRA